MQDVNDRATGYAAAVWTTAAAYALLPWGLVAGYAAKAVMRGYEELNRG